MYAKKNPTIRENRQLKYKNFWRSKDKMAEHFCQILQEMKTI